MRLLCVSNGYVPFLGGIEVMLAEVLPRLVARGHEVTAVSSHQNAALPAHEVIDGVSVHRVDMIGALHSADAGRVLRARRHFDEVRRAVAPDVVNVHDIGPNAWFELGSRAAHPAPCVVTIQTELPEVGRGDDSVASKTLTSATWVTAVSHETLRWARELASIDDRSSVIPNAVVSDAAGAEAAPTPTFVCAGRLVEQKGFDVAIDAMARLRSRHPDARLLIAGVGILEDELRQRATTLELDDSVTFLGAVRHGQMPDLLASAHAVVLPSRFEGLPLVALEAAHQARPIVASRVSGIPELVVDGVTGILVEPDDPPMLADALDRVLRDPEAASALGKAARVRVRERYSIEAVVDAYDSTFRRAASIEAHESRCGT